MVSNGTVADEVNPKDNCIRAARCPCRILESSRKRQTLHCLIAGFSEKQAATALGVSIHAVHQDVKDIYRRFRVNSRAELLARVLLMILRDFAGPQRGCKDFSAGKFRVKRPI